MLDYLLGGTIFFGSLSALYVVTHYNIIGIIKRRLTRNKPAYWLDSMYKSKSDDDSPPSD